MSLVVPHSRKVVGSIPGLGPFCVDVLQCLRGSYSGSPGSAIRLTAAGRLIYSITPDQAAVAAAVTLEGCRSHFFTCEESNRDIAGRRLHLLLCLTFDPNQ